VRSVQYSPNGSKIITDGADGLIKVWNSDTLEIEKVIKSIFYKFDYNNDILYLYKIANLTEITTVKCSQDNKKMVYLGKI
jgi:WD40 repeat protein